MSKTTDPPPASAAQLAADIGADVAAIDNELAEIDMLVGQARAESARHEQKRAQLAEKLATTDPKASPTDVADAWTPGPDASPDARPLRLLVQSSGIRIQPWRIA